MKTIYISNDYKCYVSPEDNTRAVETEIFDGKCDAYIKGYRLIPEGETWIRDDGVEFAGEAIFPWIDRLLLEAAQQKYEEASEELADADAALNELGVEFDG